MRGPFPCRSRSRSLWRGREKGARGGLAGRSSSYGIPQSFDILTNASCPGQGTRPEAILKSCRHWEGVSPCSPVPSSPLCDPSGETTVSTAQCPGNNVGMLYVHAEGDAHLRGRARRHKPTALISQSCRAKHHTPGVSKKIYLLTAQESRHLRTRCWDATARQEALAEDRYSPFPSSGGPRYLWNLTQGTLEMHVAED